MNLIGLGKMGCALVDKFARYPEYNRYKIDIGLEGLKKDGIYNFPSLKTPEECEDKCPSMKNFLKNVTGKVIFAVSGEDMLCSASLSVLETINSRARITVLYFQPEHSLVSNQVKLVDNTAFNIFQEYARSGMFEKMYIISQEKLRTIMGEVPIAEFQEKLMDQVSFAFHMINVLGESVTVYDNFSPNIELARISTVGMGSVEDDAEALFYALEYPREKTYFYLIPNEVITTDTKLMNKILNQVKRRAENGKIKINFGVYESSYKEPFVYITSNSSMIQGASL